LVLAILLFIAGKKNSDIDYEKHAPEYLMTLGIITDNHEEQISEIMNKFSESHMGLFVRLFMYATERIERFDDIISRLSGKSAHFNVIHTFLMMYWTTFFPSCFNADKYLDELWYVYDHMEIHYDENGSFCREHTDVFVYMYNVMKEKHDNWKEDDTEKRKLWELWENTKIRCQKLGCMEEGEEEGEEE
jgi:hypothetical protein